MTLRIARRALLAFAALAAFGASARADLVVSASNEFADRSTTGNSFFVIVTNTDGGPFDVNAFNVEVSIDPMAGITFTGATDGGVDYIFAGIDSLGFLVSNNTGTVIDFDDLGATSDDFRTFNGPGSFLLGEVFYDVSGSAPFQTNILNIQSVTDLVDPSGGGLNPSLINGSITVRTRSVPEPGSALLMVLGAGGLGMIAQRRRAACRARS